ncbi:AI-2E family transporter [Methanolobus halotolerans]|uniref:AI-2E family transporter n=1 Tax=Methanolobus halotolerans TaxID=2052935 RepID=A0A4E0QQM3_9EURY|nr:AI-2E family transporter [Methanolobus halotolerans]TGC08036.1 AI-2E family transporter [Methanolobus halotolerans]
MVSIQQDGVSRILDSKWKIAAGAFFLLLLIIQIFIFLPIIDGLVLGLVFAYISRPIFMKLNRFPRLGAFVATMCIVVPMVFIIGSGMFEIFRQVVWIIENQADALNFLLDSFRTIDIPDRYASDVQQLIWDFSTSFLSLMGNSGIFSYAWDLVMFALNLVISIIVCYFLLADGHKFYAAVIDIVPADCKDSVIRYFAHLDIILQGIFIGNASAALVVSILSLVVFYAFGLSNILALSALIFIASVIPMFAGYTVLLAISAYRYFDMGLESAIIFFVVSSIVIYVPPELFVRPYLASLKSHIHPLLILLAFLGGAFVGGIAGFFAAPILLGAIVAGYRVYVDKEKSVCLFSDGSSHSETKTPE